MKQPRATARTPGPITPLPVTVPARPLSSRTVRARWPEDRYAASAKPACFRIARIRQSGPARLLVVRYERVVQVSRGYCLPWCLTISPRRRRYRWRWGRSGARASDRRNGLSATSAWGDDGTEFLIAVSGAGGPARPRCVGRGRRDVAGARRLSGRFRKYGDTESGHRWMPGKDAASAVWLCHISERGRSQAPPGAARMSSCLRKRSLREPRGLRDWLAVPRRDVGELA